MVAPHPKLLYIAGYGRSGSTLLDAMLGSMPGVVGTGELTHLFSGLAGGESCSCGLVLRDCPFWSKVNRAMQAAGVVDSHRTNAERSRRVESPLRPPSRFDREQYRITWRAALNAIADLAQAEIIVDSSKTGRKVNSRSPALSELCGYEVSIVHLVRDPRAVMWSAQRGSNRGLKQGLSPHWRRSFMARTLIGWAITNLRTEILLRTHPTIPHIRIRYEDLVAFPDLTVHTILETSIGSGKIENIPQNNIAPGHGIAGNRMRWRPAQTLVLDTEWWDCLPAWAHFLAMSVWPLARRYGYRTLSYRGLTETMQDATPSTKWRPLTPPHR